MKLANLWSGLLDRINPVVQWLKKPFQAKPSIKERFNAALLLWRKRSSKVPADDISHTFKARAYQGSRARQYLVHVPHGNIGQHPRPLVMVLHGCRQNHLDIEAITGFNALADQHGFMVVYPFVTSYRGLRNTNCWGWWFKQEIHAGAGEVEDLWQIVEEVKQNYSVDSQRIHVTGLSSGAGMAVALMVAHSGKIASGAAVAGVPYSEGAEAVNHIFNFFPRNKPIAEIVSAMKAEMREVTRSIPIHIVHSKDDQTVGVQSAKNLRDSWGECFGIDVLHSKHVSNGSVGSIDWELNKYSDDEGHSVIETLFLTGPGHGWYGGNPGAYSFPQAPDVSKGIWAFFATHRLSDDFN